MNDKLIGKTLIRMHRAIIKIMSANIRPKKKTLSIRKSTINRIVDD